MFTQLSNYYYDYSNESIYLLVFWEREGNSYDYAIIDSNQFENLLSDLVANPFCSKMLSYRQNLNTELLREKGRIVAISSKL